jgi:hypothetical protein
MSLHGVDTGLVDITETAAGPCERRVFTRARVGNEGLKRPNHGVSRGKKHPARATKTDFHPFPEEKHSATSNEKTTDQREEIIVSLGNKIFLQ